MMSFSRRRPWIAVLLVLFIIIIITFYHTSGYFQEHTKSSAQPEHSAGTISITSRKLLAPSYSSSSTAMATTMEPNRMWGESCTNSDIVVNQGPTTPLPNGIPTYTVQIMNVCVTGCSISHIHLTCGWFSSARLINPKVFKRLRHDDCLVNDGKPLVSGTSLTFQYANSFRYPLSVASITC